MKTKLLIYLLFLTISISAQTTHPIAWSFGYNGTTTIEVGDTVEWDWVGQGNHDVTSIGSPSFPSAPLQNGGTYSYTFTVVGDYDFICDFHGASNMSGTIRVVDTLGVDDVETINQFSIYPNPSSEILNVKLPSISTSITIQVFDVLGKNIYKTSTLTSTSLNVEDWKDGMYFIKVSSNDQIAIKTFIKK